MSNNEISDERLNLFIDEQLDKDEMNEIRQLLLDDKVLRERVCQLKAVRELVGYAYSEVPASRFDKEDSRFYRGMPKSLAASIMLVIGVVLGWSTYEYSPVGSNGISAENTFQYVANHVSVDHQQRKIVLHIDSGDLKVVNAALNEADHLLATYQKANTPMQLEVVTNKGGINILRKDVSPYAERIQKLIEEHGVSFYACQRSVAKAHKVEGTEIILIPGVHTDKTASELIPDRLKKGWVYIKA
jgi:intracellular sulfur oxidation DsrE/DsrF family protein